MKKELVKPNSIKERAAKEIESLCDGFSCGTFMGSPSGDTGDDTEILF
ncbi:hypothetical protein [Chryseobacterium indologenes]|nr:hypothetical protein [Chryseobacterium indologenes]